jgi:hypothetical protein
MPFYFLRSFELKLILKIKRQGVSLGRRHRKRGDAPSRGMSRKSLS